MAANRIPVDSDKITILAMSGARPMIARVELSDGSSRQDPNGTQATDKHSSMPLYQVDCVLPADANDEKARMVTFTVKVSSATRPIVTPGQAVKFTDLQILAYNDQQSGRATLSWSASGVAPAAKSYGDKAA